MMDALAIAIKTLSYLAMAIAMGSVLCLALLSCLPVTEQKALRRLIPVAASVGLITLAGRVGIEVVYLAGGGLEALVDAELIQLVLSGALGRTLLIQAGGLVLSAAIVFPAVGLPLGLIGVLAVSASFGLSGHVAAYKGQWLSVLITLHWLALGFWLGIFIPLYRVCGYSHRNAARVAHSFGRLALVTVSVLVVAGGVTLYQLTGGRLLALETGYTQLFAIKLAVFALVLSLAALNKLSLTPALNRGDSLAPARMQRSLMLEGALIVIIMGVSATITTLTAPGG